MSSIQENASVPLDVVDKRKANFSRIDSFDKLHYTAFYTIQLAGTLLSQKSMLQIMDILQYKSRIFLHSSIISMFWPTFKAMCAVLLYWIDSIARYLGFDARPEKKIVSSPNVEKEETYTLRLKKRKEAAALANREAKSAENVANESISEPVDRLKTIDEINVITQRVAFTNRLKSISDSEESISPRQSIGLVVIVYGSATLVYIQLMFLAAFLQTAATPPGLLFLVLSLGFIGYIVFKMCFVKSKAKDDLNASKLQKNSSSKIIPTKSAIADDISPLKKMGRSYTRRFLYFHNKTLSKIKLL